MAGGVAVGPTAPDQRRKLPPTSGGFSPSRAVQPHRAAFGVLRFLVFGPVMRVVVFTIPEADARGSRVWISQLRFVRAALHRNDLVFAKVVR